MSVLRKKPYIKTVIEDLNDDQVKLFENLLDSGVVSKRVSLIEPKYFITDEDKGISSVRLELKTGEEFDGVLIYTDEECCFVGYYKLREVYTEDHDLLPVVKINPTTRKYNYVYERLSIEELRRMVESPKGSSAAGKLDLSVPDSFGEFNANSSAFYLDHELEENGTYLIVIEDMEYGYSYTGFITIHSGVYYRCSTVFAPAYGPSFHLSCEIGNNSILISSSKTSFDSTSTIYLYKIS